MLARKMFKRHGLNDNKVVFLLTNTAKDEGKFEAIAEASKLKKQGAKLIILLLLCLLSSRIFFFFFLIQFYVPFKIISAHMRRTNQ